VKDAEMAAMFLEDAGTLTRAASILRAYHATGRPGWFKRKTTALVIGYLNGTAGAMRQTAYWYRSHPEGA